MRILVCVEYIHSKNIVHGDIKLSNVVIGKCGAVKVIDFGYSTMLSRPDELVKAYSGTPLYFSPEIVKQQPFDGRSDQGRRPMCGLWA